MCISTPKVTPNYTVSDRSEEGQQTARDRRIQLGNQTGGRLATQLFLGGQQDRPSKILLGG